MTKKTIKYLLYLLPASLYFSYHPLISFGSNDSMNFEISLSLIWLVAFDLVAAVIVFRQKTYWRMLKRKWPLLLFPFWLTLSVTWSLNTVRGITAAGILWLICFAISAIYFLRDLFDVSFRTKFWKVFFATTLAVCLWCFIQCILDLAGLGREYSLMCAGCTYRMFGFPHPNGFAIEPQFMGNLLLAPAIISAWMFIKKYYANPQKDKLTRLGLIPCFFLISVTLFLTFSRGAIYSFIVAMIFISSLMIVAEKKARVAALKQIGLTWLVISIAFAFTLNIQGIMSAASPTSDTYQDGVAKVLNHLSLGKIDIRKEKASTPENSPLESNTNNSSSTDSPVATVDSEEEAQKEQSEFDGYVEESTNARIYLTESAIASWKDSPATLLFGVGLGGAGQALCNNQFIFSPKEIVQNQYASLLLETGIVGIVLLIFSAVLLLRFLTKMQNSIPALGLLVAYAVSLLFFSGLANALQIYLLPMLLITLL